MRTFTSSVNWALKWVMHSGGQLWMITSVLRAVTNCTFSLERQKETAILPKMLQVTHQVGNQAIHSHVRHDANTALRNGVRNGLQGIPTFRLYAHARCGLLDDAHVHLHGGARKAVTK